MPSLIAIFITKSPCACSGSGCCRCVAVSVMDDGHPPFPPRMEGMKPIIIQRWPLPRMVAPPNNTCWWESWGFSWSSGSGPSAAFAQAKPRLVLLGLPSPRLGGVEFESFARPVLEEASSSMEGGFCYSTPLWTQRVRSRSVQTLLVTWFCAWQFLPSCP